MAWWDHALNAAGFLLQAQAAGEAQAQEKKHARTGTRTGARKVKAPQSPAQTFSDSDCCIAKRKGQ